MPTLPGWHGELRMVSPNFHRLLGIAGGIAVATGLALYVFVWAQVDLRFIECKGYFRSDAPTARCRFPVYLSVAAITLFFAGIVGLVIAFLAYLRREKPH